MATLAVDKPRVFETQGDHPIYNELSAVASDIIYAGAAVSLDNTGNANPLVVTHTTNGFAGFCVEQCDNSTGAAGAKKVKVLAQGFAKLTVVGASAQANENDAVYALDDDVFTLSASNSALQIGKVYRWISGTTCIVFFQAASLRSI
jgi:hypothetical protein